MQKLWFKAKTYGWGWVPCSWEGWLVTAVGAASISLNVSSVIAKPTLSLWEVFAFCVVPTWATIFFLLVVCVLTGEKPRWRWGATRDER